MKRPTTTLIYTLMTMLVLFGIGILIVNPGFADDLVRLVRLQKVAELRSFVHSLGILGPIVAILLMILHSVTFVPSEVITITDVVLFGPVWGVVYAWVGSMLGAYLAFCLARWFGRPIVDRFVPNRLVERFDTFFEREGLKGVLILRFIPLVSFNALNYASGLTKMTFWEFTWTTGLGILPAGILVAILYQSAAGEKNAFVALSIIGVSMLIGLIVRSKLRKKYNTLSKEND